MSKYTDEDGYKYNEPAEYSAGDPIKQEELEEIAENQKLFRTCKTVMLPGNCATAVNASAESGGVFAFWTYIEDGNAKIIVNASDYEGVMPSTFTDGDGAKNRVMSVQFWLNTGANEAAVQAMMAGGANDYTLFTNDGKAPYERGCYTGAGGIGAHDIVYDYGPGTADISFYAAGSGGNIMLKLANAVGDQWYAIAGLITIGPKMTKAT